MSKKATKQEMVARSQKIQDLIRNSYTKAEICLELSKEFKCTEYAIEKQYYNILQDMQARLVEERELIRMEIAEQLREVQQNAKRVGANKVVIEAAMARAKLLGLNEKQEPVTKRPDAIIYKEKDMSTPLKVVSNEDKAENE